MASTLESPVAHRGPGRAPSLAAVAALAVLAAGLVALPAPARAQAPAHDDITRAVAVTSTFTDQTSNREATVQPGEPQPSCVAKVAGTLWYRVDMAATSTTELRVYTTGSEIDTVAAVWEGSDIRRLTERACNDDTGDEEQREAAAVIVDPGHHGAVYVQIAGFGPKHQGDLTVHFVIGRPAHDDRAAARPVATFPFADELGLGATLEESESGAACGEGQVTGNTGSAWYRATLDHHSALAAVTEGGWNTQVEVWDGTTRLACAYAESWTPLVPGGTYDVRVLYQLPEPYYRPHDMGGVWLYPRPVEVELLAYEPPPNDNQAAAAPLAVGDHFAGTLFGAGSEADEPPCRPPGSSSAWTPSFRTVWFAIIPATTGPLVVTAEQPAAGAGYLGLSIDVFEDTYGGLQGTACNEWGRGGRSAASFVARGGARYLVRISDSTWSPEHDGYTFRVDRGAEAAIPRGRVRATHAGDSSAAVEACIEVVCAGAGASATL